MATDRPRYTVSVDNELFQQIEDFRFERRFQTRSEATVELIRLGLESLKKEQQTPREKPADEVCLALPFCSFLSDSAAGDVHVRRSPEPAAHTP